MEFHFSQTSCRISPKISSESFFSRPGPISFQSWWCGRLKSSAFRASLSWTTTPSAQSTSSWFTWTSGFCLASCISLTFFCFSACSSSAISRKSVLAVSRCERWAGPEGTDSIAFFARPRPLFHQPMCFAAIAPSQPARKHLGSCLRASSASSIAHSAANPCSGSSAPSSPALRSCSGWSDRTFFLLSASCRKARARKAWSSAMRCGDRTGSPKARLYTSAASLCFPWLAKSSASSHQTWVRR
mmetsp:Transcript_7409/g.19995  ORF Transcript_7409/g.19995 Transcript_7409/m.19995 type:complete len:243 (-) Transcript_7409:379-1107(-)